MSEKGKLEGPGEHERMIPVNVRIEASGKKAERLYAAEHTLHEALYACSDAWLAVMRLPPSERWHRGVAQALFDLLQSYETASAYAAARAFVNGVERADAPFTLDGWTFRRDSDPDPDQGG